MTARPARTPAARVERMVKAAARAALRFAPPVERRLTVRAHRSGLRIEQLCLRVMVLKAWHDLFVTGDGSRRALAEATRRTFDHAGSWPMHAGV